MESKDNKGTTWDVVIGKCFTGEAYKKISQCFETKSSALLKKVRIMRGNDPHLELSDVMQNSMITAR